jgi:hypothetical protein
MIVPPPPPEDEGEEEEKKVADVEEETKQEIPFESEEIIKHEYFKCINEDESESELTPEKASIYMLACLEKVNATYFKSFGLDVEPTSEVKISKIEKKLGL